MFISAYHNINKSLIPSVNRYSTSFSGRKLTSTELDIIKTRLKNTDKEQNNKKIPPCGEIRVKNKTGKEVTLTVQKQNNKNHSVKTFFIRKKNDTKTLIGYASCFIYPFKRKIQSLYGLQGNNDKGIDFLYMNSAGQEEFQDIGKKIHQLIVETSILEGCPGKIFITSEAQFKNLSPTGFHYKNGFVPYIDNGEKYKKDKRTEDKIKAQIQKNDGYTPIDEIFMYLSPEGFEKWKKEIRENPILDATKQRISSLRANQRGVLQQLSK